LTKEKNGVITNHENFFFYSVVADIIQIIFLCVQQKKEIHTSLKQLEGE